MTREEVVALCDGVRNRPVSCSHWGLFSAQPDSSPLLIAAWQALFTSGEQSNYYDSQYLHGQQANQYHKLNFGKLD